MLATLQLNSSLFTPIVNHLEHMTQLFPLEVSSRNTNAICHLPRPKTLTESRILLTLCKVFCRFVPRLVTLAHYVTKKLCKGEPPNFDTITNNEPHPLTTLLKKLMYLNLFALVCKMGNRRLRNILLLKKLQTNYLNFKLLNRQTLAY